MSCLDTHFIKTSFIDAAGRERLKITELVSSMFQGDRLKASKARGGGTAIYGLYRYVPL